MIQDLACDPLNVPVPVRPCRVAVLVNGVPHPKHGASIVLFYHYIEALCAAGFDILCVTIFRPGQRDEPALKAFADSLSMHRCFQVYAIELPRILEGYRLRIIDRRGHGEELRRRVSEHQPDALVCFDIECAALASDIAAPYKVAWLGDLAFETHWYNFKYGVMESPATIRSLPYHLAQRSGWKRVYRQTLAAFSDVVVSSKSSEARLHELGIDSRYAPYPWPVTDGQVHEVAKPQKPRFVFFGTLVGLGSRSSFHFMFDRLYPILVQNWGRLGFEILIAGREQLPNWVAKRLQSLPEFKFLGFVDDIGSLIRGSHAVITPLDVPVGNRSRILTAMAQKVLVISHENASLGNPDLVHERNCLLARSAEQFALCMKRAVEEPDRARSMALAGYETYIERFSPEVAAPLFASKVKEKFGRGWNE